MEERIAAVSRSTKETDITVQLNLDGRGQYEVSTGIGFFDHMLEGFARHGLFDLKVTCKGDLQVDSHHTIEDVGIVLGEAIRQALGEKKAIRRYGSILLPMDELWYSAPWIYQVVPGCALRKSIQCPKSGIWIRR